MITKKQLLIINLSIAGVIILIIYFYAATASLFLKLILSRTPPPSGPISANISLAGSGILYYSNSKLLVPYALLNYTFKNITSTNISLTLYASNPIMHIYLLNVSESCWECSYPISGLNSSLYAYLSGYGLIQNSSSYGYVNLTALPSLPNDSIIVVPSGRLPGALLPDTTRYSSFTLLDILQRGDTVIYAGKDFSDWMGEGTNNYEYNTSQQILQELSQNSLNTTAISAPKINNYTRYGFYFHSPTFVFSMGNTYGPLTYITVGNGTVVAFSNVSSAWNSTTDEANDIAKVISERIWMNSLTHGAYTLNTSGSGTLSVFAVDNGLPNSQDTRNALNTTHALVRISLSNVKLSKNEEFQFRPSFSPNGSISLPARIGISESFPMIITINASNTRIYPIEILNSTFVNTFTNMPVIHPVPPNRTTIIESFYLKPGYYIASVLGVTDSSALFDLGALNITPLNVDFEHGVFTFMVTSSGIPVSGALFTGSIDGAYNTSGTVENGVLNYTLPSGTVIKYGTHTLSFDMLGTSYHYSQAYTGNEHIPAFYIEFGIAAVVMLLINLIIKDPIRDEYFVDVPSFPHMSKTVVRMGSDSIVNLFDTVNNTFHWKYMPLSRDEISAGISNNLRYENMPISITFQNLTEILYKLTLSGSLVALGDYFMPKRWEAGSRHDIEYLVIFRELRDYLVANSVLFTDLDASEYADMVITSSGRQGYIYIYSSSRGMREMRIDGRSKLYIAFLNSETQSLFTESLYASYGPDAEALKIALSASVVQLINIDDLSGIF